MPIRQLIHQRQGHSLELPSIHLVACGLTRMQQQHSRIAAMFERGCGWLVLLMGPTQAALQHHSISFHRHSQKQQLLLCCCIRVRPWLAGLIDGSYASCIAALWQHPAFIAAAIQTAGWPPMWDWYNVMWETKITDHWLKKLHIYVVFNLNEIYAR